MSRTGDNIFKRKDGRWEGRYIKFYENGKAKYGYVYARTYSETKAKLLTAIRNNTEESNKEYFNFKYWLDYWLKLCLLAFSPDSSKAIRWQRLYKYLSSITSSYLTVCQPDGLIVPIAPRSSFGRLSVPIHA